MKRSFWIVTALGLAGITASLIYLLRPDTTEVKTTYTHHDAFAQKGQAMVPWRDAPADMKALFPGAPVPDTGNPKIVALSSHRADIIKRLGNTPLDSNALYVFPVENRGAVLLRRVSGEFGGIEVVLGVDASGKAVGVRVQRHREPPEIEKILLSPEFQKSFVGKTAQSDFTLPTGTPSGRRSP
ncbi:MAG: hypothetical protein QM758_10480 [Armatimonas sp.]